MVEGDEGRTGERGKAGGEEKSRGSEGGREEEEAKSVERKIERIKVKKKGKVRGQKGEE